MSRPTANDVHIPGPMGNERKRKPIQKPWTVANVPDNLKGWPENMRARFAEIATRVLEETGDEEAIEGEESSSLRVRDVTEDGLEAKEGEINAVQ